MPCRRGRASGEFAGSGRQSGSDRLSDDRSYMENNPFAQTTKGQDTLASRRRSTRIDFVTTVLLSGKDGAGTPFREFTQTVTVNLHGCKLRTSYRIMVGMLVTLECPKAGTSGKGVCVRIWDGKPGVAGHEIAIQLIKPQNLWSVPNPPPDWEVVAKSMVQGRAGQSSPAPPAVAVAPRAPAPSPVAAPRAPAAPPPVAPAAPLSERTGRFAAPVLPGTPTPTPVSPLAERTGRFAAPVLPNAASPVALPAAPLNERTGRFQAPVLPTAPAPAAPPAAPLSERTGRFAAPVLPSAPAPVAPAQVAPPPPAPPRPAPVAGPTVDQRLGELERRATQLVESVLDIMRGQAEEMTRNILEEFRQQVDALIQDGEVRLRQGLQQAYEESAASLIGLRTDLMEQMASRGSQIVRTTEDTLRTRLRGQLAIEDKSDPAKPPAKVAEK